jgi:RND family efflux transporter MFP subunit
MTRLIKAFSKALFSLTGVVLVGQLLISPCVWAQEDLFVQPASRDITLTGYTRSQTTVTLSSEVAGRVIKINYDDGQEVGKLPLLSVDPTFIDLEINSTEQTLEHLQITHRKRRSRVGFLDKEFRRIDNLFRRGSSPESRRDTAREDVDQARLDLKAIGIEIAVAKTRLQELRERKRRHEIYAPAGWIVVAKQVEAGELVTVNTPVARVADFEHLVVPLSVSAQELAAIQQLTPEFDVLLDDKPAKAAINWVNPEFDEKTRKLKIELILRSYPGPKRGGLTCRLALKTATEGLWIPKEAVISRYENPRVFLTESGAEVKVLVLGQTENHLIIADDRRLPPGTRLRAPDAFRLKSYERSAR